MKATPCLLTLALCTASLFGLATTEAGTYKRITIDGSFMDWAGVAPAYVDPEDMAGNFDFKEIYLANDEKYLYVRVTIYQPRDFGSYHHQILVDADADASTGNTWVGVGSELLIEDGLAWQEKNGGFNEGAASGLDWAEAPTGQITEFEARISRDVRDAEGLPVFSQNNIALAFRVVGSDWASNVDTAPGTEGIPYEFAPIPPKATGSRTLLSLTGALWQYYDGGTDPGTEWLTMNFDDTQPGWKTGSGLFGFGSPGGSYPASIKTPLSAGHTSYYFRAPFTWNYDANGVALVVSNYVSDGAAVYLNGVEAKRLRLPDGSLTSATLATAAADLPGVGDVLSLPAGALVVGTNLVEVEVHGATATPQALAFGLALIASDNVPPSVEDSTQPPDRAVVEGDTTSFTAGRIFGTEPMSYQWFKDEQIIPGATNAMYTIPAVLVGDTGLYHVEVSNATGTTIKSRDAKLSTSALPVAISDMTQPADCTVTEGEATTFAVAYMGSPAFTYQWFKDTKPIDGATNAEYSITTALLTDAGGYSVGISNRLGGVTSRTAQLVVLNDTLAPFVTQVTGGGTRMLVTFSEPVDETSAAQPANYTLTDGAKVQGAVVDTQDQRNVALTTTALKFGTVYTLGVMGVKDRFNNPANHSAKFRATILMDGNFDDWAGIPVLDTEPQDTPEGIEFKEISATNDDEYLYIRFSFYAQIGELPVDYFYHIFVDTDNDPTTGMSTLGLGSEMMIENGGGYQQKNKGFNEGDVDGLDFNLAPTAKASEFEVRLSRKATFHSDGTPVFTNSTIALAFELLKNDWTGAVEGVPQGSTIAYTFASLPPMDAGTLKVQKTSGQIEISWAGNGALEMRDSLSTGTWSAVPNPANPYRVNPTGTQRFYRLKQ